MNGEYIAATDDRILVTGSNGFIGAIVGKFCWNTALSICAALCGQPAVWDAWTLCCHDFPRRKRRRW
jgi:hypothetical protein